MRLPEARFVGAIQPGSDGGDPTFEVIRNYGPEPTERPCEHGGFRLDERWKSAEHRGRFPAFDWALRFCGRTRMDELAASIRSAAETARAAGRMGVFDDGLRESVLCAAPLIRIPPRRST